MVNGTFIITTAVMVSPVYTNANMYQIIHFKYVHFVLCHLSAKKSVICLDQLQCLYYIKDEYKNRDTVKAQEWIRIRDQKAGRTLSIFVSVHYQGIYFIILSHGRLAFYALPAAWWDMIGHESLGYSSSIRETKQTEARISKTQFHSPLECL